MTMDFGFLKDVMMHKIHDVFDHGLAVYMHDELLTDILITGILPCNIQALQGSATSYQPVAALGGLKVILTSFIPTAEALARAWWYAMEKDVRARSAHNARLEAVRVHETPNSVGVYYHA